MIDERKEVVQRDVRCECCGYMTHHREHLGCIRAASARQAANDIEAQTKSVALVAHCGGLIGLSESDALIAIRKLTLPHSDDLWGLSVSETQTRLKEVLQTLERIKT